MDRQSTKNSRHEVLPPFLFPAQDKTQQREDYLLCLRSLTRMNRPKPLIDALVKAQNFSNLDFSSYPKILKTLENRNWFKEADEAKIVV